VTHSSDFAWAFYGLMGNIHAIGEAVHITSDESLTWNQIYECVGAAVGKKPILRHISSDFLVKCNPELEGGLLGDKSNSVVFDNSKIKRLVPDFVATTRFDEGVRECVACFLENEHLQVEDVEFDAWVENVIGRYDNA
jgi:nucleoside-diphosphate-sugar epimerase